MKKIFLAAVAAFVVAGLVFVACKKESKTHNETPTKLTSHSTGNNQPCCSITCEKGSCYSYADVCHCACTFLNKPDCHGSSSNVAAMSDNLFDGREHIILNENFLTEIANDQEVLYSLNKTYATEVADKLDDFVTLINTYGYHMNTKQALLDYYAIIDYINARESLFTIEELQLF